jgi:hypothetical protein
MIIEFLLVVTLVEESWGNRKVYDQHHPLDIAPHAMRKLQLEDSRSTQCAIGA